MKLPRAGSLRSRSRVFTGAPPTDRAVQSILPSVEPGKDRDSLRSLSRSRAGCCRGRCQFKHGIAARLIGENSSVHLMPASLPPGWSMGLLMSMRSGGSMLVGLTANEAVSARRGEFYASRAGPHSGSRDVCSDGVRGSPDAQPPRVRGPCGQSCPHTSHRKCAGFWEEMWQFMTNGAHSRGLVRICPGCLLRIEKNPGARCRPLDLYCVTF